jgi:uncharacterized protein YdaU (DUF1376 family)
MHYYQFNIGDYASHTQHLDEIEDLAYRRMLDYCYLNEIGLPESVNEIARLIRMRTHSVCIANVLREFFTLHSDGMWRSDRVEREIQAFRDKSGKAAKAARKRWDKADANALPTHSERNANHKPLTINQEPVKESRASPFAPPTLSEVADYISENRYPVDPSRFIDFYESKGWMVGKNKMKCWKAAVRTWSKRDENTKSVSGIDPNERGISGAERTRRARELRRREEKGIAH